jgi:hypothetical protein
MKQENGKQQQGREWIGASILIPAILALCAAQLSFAQIPSASSALGATAVASGSTASVRKTQVKAADAEEENEAAKPGGEGLKIHGHWVLELKNPDGRLVERREFNNALITGGNGYSGDQLLAALLAGDAVPAFPVIVFLNSGISSGYDPSTACQSSGSYITPCYAFENNSTNPFEVFRGSGFYADIETGLTMRVSYTFGAKVSLSLTGNYPVPPSTIKTPLTQIAGVETVLPICANGKFAQIGFQSAGSGRSADTSPIACVNNPPNGSGGEEDLNYFALTYTAVPNGPMAVTPGQTVTVTVTLTFS